MNISIGRGRTDEKDKPLTRNQVVNLLEESGGANIWKYGGPICLDSFGSKIRQNTSIQENSFHLHI